MVPNVTMLRKSSSLRERTSSWANIFILSSLVIVSSDPYDSDMLQIQNEADLWPQKCLRAIYVKIKRQCMFQKCIYSVFLNGIFLLGNIESFLYDYIDLTYISLNESLEPDF